MDCLVDFEDERLFGKTPTFGFQDDATTGYENTFWFCDKDVVNDSFFARNYNRESCEAVSNGYLTVSMGKGALYRSFSPLSVEAEVTEALAIGRTNLFVDAWVQFGLHGSLEDPETLAAKGLKVACWGYGGFAGSFTNFIVTAGGWDDEGNYQVRNYTTRARIDPNAWHRLTVRAILNAATSGTAVPGFAIYVDGELVTCDADEYMSAHVGEARFGGNEYFEKRALFPTLQLSLANGWRANALYGMAFMGGGFVDNVLVTRRNPVAVATNVLEATLNLDDNAFRALSVVTQSVDGVSVTNVLAAPFNGRSFPVYPGEKVSFLAQMNDTFVLKSSGLRIAGNVGAVASYRKFTLTMADGAFSEAGRLLVLLDTEQQCFSVDGDTYASFNEAIEAATYADDHLIRLIGDVVISTVANDDDGQARVLPDQEAVLDLAGHSITGTNFRSEATIYNQGTLTVCDSVGGGEIAAEGTVIENIRDNDAVDVRHAQARLAMGSLASKMFTVKGRVRCTAGELVIRTGTYLSPSDVTDADTAFYLASYVDPDPRYSVFDPDPQPEGVYWPVGYNNRLLVAFETPHGTVAPTNFAAIVRGQPVTNEMFRPVVNAPGYTLAGWHDKATGAAWDLATPVVCDTNLVADLTLDTSTITYANYPGGAALAPDEYTVEDPLTELPVPSKANFTFAGWLKRGTTNVVASVGAGATYAGTDEPVSGDLDLVAQWTTNRLVWTNLGRGLAESNGWYFGSWPMTLSFENAAGGAAADGQKIRVEAIRFCLVNPTQYPEVGERLAVKPEGGAAVVSAPCAWTTDGALYVTGTNVLANGRAEIAYRFGETLTLASGTACEVSFTAGAGGTTVTGFLRLAHCPAGDDATFGNCAPSGAPGSNAEYGAFCPVYEIEGRAVEEVTP